MSVVSIVSMCSEDQQALVVYLNTFIRDSSLPQLPVHSLKHLTLYPAYVIWCSLNEKPTNKTSE